MDEGEAISGDILASAESRRRDRARWTPRRIRIPETSSGVEARAAAATARAAPEWVR